MRSNRLKARSLNRVANPRSVSTWMVRQELAGLLGLSSSKALNQIIDAAESRAGGHELREIVSLHAEEPCIELPPRERDTLLSLLRGDSEKQVATKLGLSVHTVHVYVKSLYRRYKVSSRGELFARLRHQSPRRTVQRSLQLPGHASGGTSLG